MRHKVIVAVSVGVVGLAAGCVLPPSASAEPQASEAAAASQYLGFVDTYCVGCHNPRLLTAGLSLEGKDLSRVSDEPELWERVIRKVGGRMMPPPGARAPAAAAVDGFTSFLASALDTAAAANPHPGEKVLKRLNRAEYGNAVRDVFHLDVDVSELLPPDVDAFGFDNMAAVLGISPSLMDRYLSAAWTITSQAIGDTNLTPRIETFRVRSDLSQNDHIEGLPVGTRGGLLIEHNFPVDGEYVIQPRLWRNTVAVIRGLEHEHDLEITVDGERVLLERFGGIEEERINYLIPQAEGDKIEARFRVRVPLTAGPHRVGVAFVKKSSAAPLHLLQPFLRDNIDPIDPTGIPVLERVTIEGPFDVTGPGASPSRRRIMTCYPDDETEALGCARDILSRMARLAYRRPVTDAEVATLVDFYQQERGKGESFDVGIQTALVSILVSPQFLFRFERDPEDAAPGAMYRIRDLEMASRLSFFIWSSVPDDELLDLAIAGRLQEPEILQEQIERMLADERAGALGANFAGQWLYLRNVVATEPDADLFPDFDDNLRKGLQRETELLFESIAREDRSVLDLLTADYTFVNERVARHYGIRGVYGDQFRRVDVEDENRKGLLGHASVMLINSYANRTSPVNRGKYVLTNIIGTPPPPPPPNVPPLEENLNQPAAMRERMAQHRANPACSGCHQYMDPVGLALENFDAIGRWREAEDDLPIDAAGAIPVFRDFGPIDGPVGLREAILSRSEQFASTATEMLLTYALGRGLEARDMPIVRAVVRDAADENYRFSTLVRGIVTSTPFQMRTRRAEPDPTARLESDGEIAER